MSTKEKDDQQHIQEHAIRCGISLLASMIVFVSSYIIWSTPLLSDGGLFFQSKTWPSSKSQSFINQSNDSNLAHFPSEKNYLDDLTTFGLNITDYVGTQSVDQIISESRVIPGNKARFWRFFNQIFVQNKCVTTLVLGGSVSSVGKRGNSSTKWWVLFNKWLNERHPCKSNNDTHKIISKAVGATNTQYVLDHFRRIFIEDKQYDLIFIEYAINDVGYKHAANPACSAPKMAKESILECTAMKMSEILIRNILSLYFTHSDYYPLIMYLEMGYDRGHIAYNDHNPYFKAATFAHEKIAFYYQLPMISWNHVILPSDIYTFCTQNIRHCPQNPKWFEDGHHPNINGHKLAALLLAYNFDIEANNGYPQILAFDHEKREELILPKPWILTQEEEHRNNLAHISKLILTHLDFTKPHNKNAKKNIVYNKGWTHYPETKKKKYGLIATKKNSLVVFKVNVTDTVQIAYLATYKNIGAVVVWTNAFRGNDGIDCNVYYKNNKKQSTYISGYHDDRTSVYQSVNINVKTSDKSECYLHICLLSKEKHGMKFKILFIETK